ncbi:acyltransferase family protein [uncultured Agrococcus sp.]|uniref:acyltransferase family protein n=1 Tax=uncultured Agrococcus sp. TaxID=382258 RepID=UPI0025DF7820|nr:acyltransferase family protein [uncultured Agrococcus sp.]
MTQPQEQAKRFRPEIEGLRSVAFVLVAVYHVWFNRVSGGVDVFFAVSGFLITLTLLGHVRRYGTIQPLTYLARLATRLLPAATVVCIVVFICTVILRPLALWQDTFDQIIASMFYWENWYLAWNSVDYLATDQSRSPLQHFWAMSIQGQFYVLWLLLFLVAVRIGRGSEHGTRRIVTGVIAVLVLASFAWSIVQTQQHQQFAYFSTLTRVWEFGAGALLALLIHRVRMPSALAGALSWLGLAVLVSIGFLLPVGDVFPGWVAALPVLAAVAVMVAGENGAKWGANALLATRPFVWMGGFGYGFYLWHWPVMIFTLTVLGRTEVGFLTGLGILGLSFVLAYLTVRLVERPLADFRASKRAFTRRTVTAVAVVSAVATGGLGFVGDALVAQRTAAQAQERWEVQTEPCFGALALHDEENCEEDVSAPVLPKTPGNDSGRIFADDCHTRPTGTELKPCSWGDRNGTVRIALVGNSHGAVWFPALRALADQHGWQLDTFNKASCSFNTTGRQENNQDVRETCLDWIADLLEHFGSIEPYDFIFTSAFAGNSNFIDPATGEMSLEAGVAGYREAWQWQIERGTQIIVMRDYPMTTNETIECSRLQPRAPCFTELAEMQTPLGQDVIAQAALQVEGAWLVDMTRWFCLDGVCPGVIGDVHVYRDYHHFTETYGMSLAIPLELELREQSPIPDDAFES